jgi:hypothetical protein
MLSDGLPSGINRERLAIAIARESSEFSNHAFLPEVCIPISCSIGKDSVADNLPCVVYRLRGDGTAPDRVRVQIDQSSIAPKEGMAVCGIANVVFRY